MTVSSDQFKNVPKEEMERISKQTDLVAAYKFTFNTPDGKRVLHDILKRGHILNAAFVPNPYATAYNEGMRSVGVEILNMMKIDMNKFLERYREGQVKENSYDRLG